MYLSSAGATILMSLLVGLPAMAGIASVNAKAKSESAKSPVRRLKMSSFLRVAKVDTCDHHRRYCSSLTFSSQSTFLPF